MRKPQTDRQVLKDNRRAGLERSLKATEPTDTLNSLGQKGPGRSQEGTRISRPPHLFQQRLAELSLLLHQHEHLLVHGSCQVEVQLLRAGGHLADELLVREDAVAAQAAVVLNALPAGGELEGGGEKRMAPRKWKSEAKRS